MPSLVGRYVMSNFYYAQEGKARYAILMWLLGVPLPIIALIYLLGGGCN